MATTRKPSTRKTAKKTQPAPLQQVSEAEKQAKLEAYNALKQAGVDIPQELLVVEEWIEEIQKQRQEEQDRINVERQRHADELEEANKNGPWYVRNGYPAPFNLRLDRQTEKRRIELKPRGTPGDLHPLLEEDLKDPVLRQNLNLGLIELIPAGEANIIINKQTTNMGRREHTPLSILRNENNRPYEQGQVKVETEFNSQGIVVAQHDPRALQGQLTDKEIQAQATNMAQRRQGPLLPGEAQPPQATSVIRSGFVPTAGNPAQVKMGNEAHDRAVDDLARRKNLEGPQAGLGDVRVVVDPVRRT